MRDMTRTTCGKSLPNPAARADGTGNITGVEPWFCAVLGTDSLPPAALKLAALEKSKARRQQPERPRGYQPPASVRGQLKPKPSREHPPDSEPVIPTHILRAEKQTQPNQPCPCGSGRKYKKCCGK